MANISGLSDAQSNSPNPPRVSVMIPVYNAARYLPRTIEGILNQTFRDFELIILNDGSTDDSLDIAARYARTDSRIRLVSRPNRGVVATRNELLSLATADLAALQDADDLSHPLRLERQVHYMQDHPQCVIVGTAMELIDPDGIKICAGFELSGHDAIDQSHLNSFVSAIGPTIMLRTGPVRAAGGYREGFQPSEDFDLYLRMAEIGQLANLPEALVSYRMHPASLSHTLTQVQRNNAVRAVEEALQRRGLPPLTPTRKQAALRMTHRSPLHLWVRKALLAKNYASARKLAQKAWRAEPLSVESWTMRFLAALGPPGRFILSARLRMTSGIRALRHRVTLTACFAACLPLAGLAKSTMMN